MSKPFTIANKTFQSRLIVGTGKYPSHAIMKQCHELSGAQMVTVAVRRLDLKAKGEDSLLHWIDSSKLTLLPNTAGCYTAEEAIRIWRGRNAAGVRTVVAVHTDGSIMGTGSLILEHKFIHRGGTIGHIEDVAVHPNHEGKGVGSAVVRAIVELARQSGCYKVILSCNDQNLAFYSKLGFHKHDNGMRIDLK